MMSQPVSPWTIGICDLEPVTAAGVAALLAKSDEFRVAEPVPTLEEARESFADCPAVILLLDQAFGAKELHAALGSWGTQGRRPKFVVWGKSFGAAETTRYIQAGASGVLERSSSVQTILECLQTVAAGEMWLSNTPLDPELAEANGPRTLTPREQEVRELVEQGLKNYEIADRLGICMGTVKIHVKHIFEKTGLRSRYGLALAALRTKDAEDGSGRTT